MKFKSILTIATLIVLASCNKKGDDPITADPNQKYSISGTVSGPSGEPLQGVTVGFDNDKKFIEVKTDAAGKYTFRESGSKPVDIYFDGNSLYYLNMRDLDVSFGKVDRTLDKMIVPWQIEELAYLKSTFTDSIEKEFSLILHNFEEMKMKPSDFSNMKNTRQINDYETTLTSVQTDRESEEVTVSFYSIPKSSGYTVENYDEIPYAEMLKWEKILTTTTTTTSKGVREPVVVNIAAAYSKFPNYDHSGAFIMVSDSINETLDVTSAVDILEIRLPYGNDFIPRD